MLNLTNVITAKISQHDKKKCNNNYDFHYYSLQHSYYLLLFITTAKNYCNSYCHTSITLSLITNTYVLCCILSPRFIGSFFYCGTPIFEMLMQIILVTPVVHFITWPGRGYAQSSPLSTDFLTILLLA